MQRPELPFTKSLPIPNSILSGVASSRCAAIFFIFSFRSCAARYTAVPPTDVPRLPNVPMPEGTRPVSPWIVTTRSEEHTSELQSRVDLVCRLLLEKKKQEKKAASAVPHTPS